MKKLSLIAAGLLLGMGLIAYAASSTDVSKAREEKKSSCEQACSKASGDKLSCDTTDCPVVCCPVVCTPRSK